MLHLFEREGGVVNCQGVFFYFGIRDPAIQPHKFAHPKQGWYLGNHRERLEHIGLKSGKSKKSAVCTTRMKWCLVLFFLAVLSCV